MSGHGCLVPAMCRVLVCCSASGVWRLVPCCIHGGCRNPDLGGVLTLSLIGPVSPVRCGCVLKAVYSEGYFFSGGGAAIDRACRECARTGRPFVLGVWTRPLSWDSPVSAI